MDVGVFAWNSKYNCIQVTKQRDRSFVFLSVTHLSTMPTPYTGVPQLLNTVAYLDFSFRDRVSYCQRGVTFYEKFDFDKLIDFFRFCILAVYKLLKRGENISRKQ